MLCEQYEKLTPMERSEYIGKLVHAAMNNDLLFSAGEKIIKQGTKMGLFEKIKFNPAPIPNPVETENIPNRLKTE